MHVGFGTSWTVRLLLLACIWAICLAGSVTAVTVHHCQDVPTSMCEYFDGDELDEAFVQDVATPLIMTPQVSLVTTSLLMTSRDLSPVIFQPPETA